MFYKFLFELAVTVAVGIILFCLMVSVQGCANLSPIHECKSLCQGKKVEFFKDDLVECRCAGGLK